MILLTFLDLGYFLATPQNHYVLVTADKKGRTQTPLPFIASSN